MEENLTSHQKALGLCRDSWVQGCRPPPCFPKVPGTLGNTNIWEGEIQPHVVANFSESVSKGTSLQNYPLPLYNGVGNSCTHTSVQGEGHYKRRLLHVACASELDSSHMGFTANVVLKNLKSVKVSRMTRLFYLESFCNIYVLRPCHVELN